MQRRIWFVLAVITLVGIGIYFLPTGLRNLFWLVQGKVSKSNYPGVLFATPAWIVMLPLAAYAGFRIQNGGRLCMITGFVGAFGELTIPCAWQRENWAGASLGFVFSVVFALVGLWVSRQPEIQRQ